MQKPLISVVVPIYNGERYLRKCLNSIVNQTFRDIEIILVNDGSTDSSLKICEAYARKDKRIAIINKRNEGIAFARRDGLAVAQGEYVYFVDSDDYIEQNALEKLTEIAKYHNVDVVISNFDRVLDSWGFLKKEMGKFPESDRILSMAEMREYMIGGGRMLATMPSFKLYRIDCFRKAMDAHEDLLFPQNNMPGEDRFMNLALAPFLESGWVTNDVQYHYRRGGLTTKYYPLIKRGGWYFDAKFDMCKQYGLEHCLSDAFSCYVSDLYFDLMQQVHLNIGTESEQKQFIEQELITRKIVHWARRSLSEDMGQKRETNAVLRGDVDEILQIAQQKERRNRKYYIMVHFLKLYQRIF